MVILVNELHCRHHLVAIKGFYFSLAFFFFVSYLSTQLQKNNFHSDLTWQDIITVILILMEKK